MNDETKTELAQKFGLNTEHHDVSKIPEPILEAMQYIDSNTGLLGDYHDGIVHAGENGQIIQWYARGRYFSAHDDLLHWVQQEAPKLILGQVGIRAHPETGEPTAYAEIHLASKWGYDDE